MLRAVAIAAAGSRIHCSVIERDRKSVYIDFDFLNPNDYAVVEVLFESIQDQATSAFTARIIGGVASNEGYSFQPVELSQWVDSIALRVCYA